MIRWVVCSGCKTRLELEGGLAASEVHCPTCDMTVEVPAVDVGPGITVGGFAVEKLISVGGMGKLFLARQLSMDRLVALKILPPQFCADPENVERFLNEVRMAARLQHPNVVSAYEAGTDEGVHYLAMQYIEGQSLVDRIQAEGPLAEKEALRIGRKLATALAYGWEQHQIIHRDVKPENILLDQSGEPRLVDMGISKSLAATAEGTAAGTVMGTLNYMSPEQMNELASADSRSDMFSLGATLYHALTGTVPFEGKAIVETLQHMAVDALPDPREVVPAVSRNCVDLLHVMLARKPEHRHQTWKALMADMDRVARKFPIKAPVPKGKASLIRAWSHSAAQGATKKHTVHIKHSGIEKHRVHVHDTHTGHARHAKHGRTAPVLHRPKKTSPAVPIAIAATVVIGLLFAGIAASRHKEKLAQANAARRTRARVEALERQLEAIIARAQAHPEAFDAAKAALLVLAPKLSGTRMEGEAEDAIVRLKHASALAQDAAWQALRGRVDRLVLEGKQEEGLALLRDYDGAFADALRSFRSTYNHTLVERTRTQEAAAIRRKSEALQAARTELDQLIERSARALLAGRYADVRSQVAAKDAGGSLDLLADQWVPVRKRIVAAANVEGAILDSFRKDAGLSVTVGLKDGDQTLRIRRAEGEEVVADYRASGGATVLTRFRLADLTSKERFTRAGIDGSEAGVIRQGLVAARVGANDSAAKCFQQGDGPLAKALYRAVDSR